MAYKIKLQISKTKCEECGRWGATGYYCKVRLCNVCLTSLKNGNKLRCVKKQKW